MKNVETLNRSIPGFRISIHGMPRLHGWAVQYVSGMQEEPDIKPGHWLSNWHADDKGVTFAFDPEMHMCFPMKGDAGRASELLVKAEIKTAVVRVGA